MADGIEIRRDGAMLNEPMHNEYMAAVLRERAVQAGAETVMDEANLVFNAIKDIVEQNGMTRERGEELLYYYVTEYINVD